MILYKLKTIIMKRTMKNNIRKLKMMIKSIKKKVTNLKVTLEKTYF